MSFYNKTRATSSTPVDESNGFYGETDGRTSNDNTSAQGEMIGFYGTKTHTSYAKMEELIEQGDELLESIEEQTELSTENAASALANKDLSYEYMLDARASKESAATDKDEAKAYANSAFASAGRADDSDTAASNSLNEVVIHSALVEENKDIVISNATAAAASEENSRIYSVSAGVSESNSKSSEVFAKQYSDSAGLAMLDAQASAASASEHETDSATNAEKAEEEADRAEYYANALSNGVVPRGAWDASTGLFPDPPLEQDIHADAYRIEVGGTMTGNKTPDQDDITVIAGDLMYWSIDLHNFYRIRVQDVIDADYIMQAVLSKDGAGSGLDADKLGGKGKSHFATADEANAAQTKADSAYTAATRATSEPSRATEIPASQNLNSYTNAGFYYQTANADAGSGTNYPVGQAGALNVYKSAGSIQEYTTYATNYPIRYLRAYYNGTWGAWKRQADVDYVASAISNGTAAKVRMNSSTSTSWYGVAWNSGDTLYTGLGKLEMQPSTGALRTDGNVTGMYVSDIRIKRNIFEIENPIQKAMSLRTVSYEKQDLDGDYYHEVGFIAQDVEKVFPQITKLNSRKLLTIQQGGFELTALAIATSKAQQKLIEDLTEQVEELKGIIKGESKWHFLRLVKSLLRK